MGPPDRFEFVCEWSYWVLPGAFIFSLVPHHVSSIGAVFGPFSVRFNWGPYLARPAPPDGVSR